jgi:hypothetical protein
MSIKLMSLVLVMGFIEALTGTLDYTIDNSNGEYRIALSEAHFKTLNNQYNLTLQYGVKYHVPNTQQNLS